MHRTHTHTHPLHTFFFSLCSQSVGLACDFSLDPNQFQFASFHFFLRCSYWNSIELRKKENKCRKKATNNSNIFIFIKSDLGLALFIHKRLLICHCDRSQANRFAIIGLWSNMIVLLPQEMQSRNWAHLFWPLSRFEFRFDGDSLWTTNMTKTIMVFSVSLWKFSMFLSLPLFADFQVRIMEADWWICVCAQN